MTPQLDPREGLIVEYVRARGRLEMPPDLVVSVIDAARGAPQQRASWFGAFAPTLAAVASVVLIAVVAGLLSQPTTGPAPAPSISASTSPSSATTSGAPQAATPATMIVGPATCTDVRDGLSVTVPPGWYTNAATPALPACRWFAREPFEASAPDDDPPWAAVSLDVEPSKFAVPEGPLLRQETTIAGHAALRLELRAEESGRDGGPDPRLYMYVATLGAAPESAPSLTIRTSTGRPGDYSANRDFVDQLAAGLTLSAPIGSQPLPMLQAAIHETNDIVSDGTFSLGYSDGTTVYSETLTRDKLQTSGWFGPFGESFLRIGSDGGRSTLSIMALTDKAPRTIQTDDAQILAATLSPDGDWIYFARASAAADLGVWRVPANGGGPVQVMNSDTTRPMPPGRLATPFTWTPDGKLLVVQHCRGDRGDDCTWTLISAATGAVVREVVPSQPVGLLVGIANDRLLAGRDCDGLSCTSSLVDFATGATSRADQPGARETLIESEAGPILLQDSGTGASGYRITATELETGRSWTAYQTGGPGRVLVTLERAFGGVQLQPGWFALAMEGQLGTQHVGPPLLVNAVDQRQIELANLGEK
jgi:hypothetical protein